MYRHIRRGAAGFSFIELLVTIIIAGIAFAALVPVFVQATKGISADKVRLVATNIAQDRLEKIRQLDYELITETNLANNSTTDPFYFGQFGTTWEEQTQSGTRVFTVAYSVTEDTVRATKLVTVTVDWVGPPSPHAPVVMSTVIYRQWVGPAISWWFGSSAVPVVDPVAAGPVKINVAVSTADVNAMAPVTLGTVTAMGRVDFKVTSVGGTMVSKQSVDYNHAVVDDLATHTQYVYPWPLPAADGSRDGNYAFTAVAYTAKGLPGNTLSTIFRVETGAPAAVTNLQATNGDRGSTLTWTASVSGDVDHYEVWRWLTAAGPTTDVEVSPPNAKVAGWLQTSYTDVGVPPGTYTYRVTAVDWPDGSRVSRSSSSTIGSVITNNGAVAANIAPATGLTGSVAGGSVSLSWTASASTSVTGYVIFKDGVNFTTVPSTSTTFTLSQGWNSSAQYQVKASSDSLPSDLYATMGTPGTGCLVVPVGGVSWLQAIVHPQSFALAITNNLKDAGSPTTLLTLKLEKLVGSTWVVCNTPTGLSEFTGVSYGATMTWTNLTPELNYKWTWTYTGSGGTPPSATAYFSGSLAATVTVQ